MGYIEDKVWDSVRKRLFKAEKRLLSFGDSKISTEKPNNNQKLIRIEIDGDPCSRVAAAWMDSHLNIPTFR